MPDKQTLVVKFNNNLRENVKISLGREQLTWGSHCFTVSKTTTIGTSRLNALVAPDDN